MERLRFPRQPIRQYTSHEDGVRVLAPEDMPVLTEFATPSLSVNCAWTLVGNIIFAGSQWAMLVLLAKVATPQVVGRFALALALATPIVLFFGMQLRSIQVTDARNTFRFQQYLGLRLLTIPLILLVIMAIVVGGRYEGQVLGVIVGVTLAKVVESVSDIMHGVLQRYEQLKISAVALMMKGPLGLAGLALGVLLTHDLRWGVFGLAVAWAMVLLLYEMPVAKVTLRRAGVNDSFCPSFAKQGLQQLAWLALPLGLVMTLNALNVNVPRYFVERVEGESALGVFSALAYLPIAGATIVFSFCQAFAPRMARCYARGDFGKYQFLLMQLVGIALALGVAGLVVALIAGESLLAIMYRPEYAVYQHEFIVLMIAAIPMYIGAIFGMGMTASRRFAPQLPLFLCVTGVTVLVCWIVVPRTGVLGAALAVLVAAVVQAIGSILIVRNALRHPTVKEVAREVIP